MFSRLVSQSGVLTPVIRQEFRKRLALAVLQARTCSSVAKTTSVTDRIANWDKANEVYYGKERDTQNFPILKQPDAHPPVRMHALPESWFQFFYEKTGVTGPYVFGAGLFTFLISKELWVIEHGFPEFFAFWGAFYFILSKVGPGLSKYLIKTAEDYEHENWTKPLQETKQQAQQVIEDTEKAIWREDGQKYLFEAKRENVHLQLESQYRQRLSEAHAAVKNRLDYFVDLEAAKRNFEQQHMVNWIVDSVVKGITPQQEKDSISKCIQDLKAISARV